MVRIVQHIMMLLILELMTWLFKDKAMLEACSHLWVVERKTSPCQWKYLDELLIQLLQSILKWSVIWMKSVQMRPLHLAMWKYYLMQTLLLSQKPVTCVEEHQTTWYAIVPKGNIYYRELVPTVMPVAHPALVELEDIVMNVPLGIVGMDMSV